MTNEIAVRNGQTEVSPWRAYADETQASAIAGDILKFVKGRWYRGEEKKLVEPDLRLLCNMHEIWSGWVRWFKGKPVEHRIRRLIDNPPKLSRNDLGHLDEKLWETDPSGNPKDPWAMTDRLVMKDIDTDDLLTFSTSSWGGRKALGKLCRAFDRDHRGDSTVFPVVQLGVVTRQHDTYGPIDEPSFEIVGWRRWDDNGPSVEVTSDDPRTQIRDALEDDEIPF